MNDCIFHFLGLHETFDGSDQGCKSDLIFRLDFEGHENKEFLIFRSQLFIKFRKIRTKYVQDGLKCSLFSDSFLRIRFYGLLPSQRPPVSVGVKLEL